VFQHPFLLWSITFYSQNSWSPIYSPKHTQKLQTKSQMPAMTLEELLHANHRVCTVLHWVVSS